jgi:four helix bundle protein
MPSRFEDLQVWQKARELTREVYDVTSRRAFARDFGLRDQIRRAAVSVMSNIAEGFERGSDAEFGRFLLIAKGSCGEVRSQLYVASDQGYLDEHNFDGTTALAVEVSRMLQGFRAQVGRRLAGKRR